MKRNMKTLTFWYFLTFLKTYECTAVVLSTDHDFGTENETFTFICSTGTIYDFVSFLNETTSIGDIGYINDICQTSIKTANCSCVNVTTYTCTTTLTRLNNDDSWKCRATRNGIGIHSNTVSVIVKVPIEMATINPYVFGQMTIDEGDELRLTCEAQHSIPASSIIWYLDNKTDGFYGDDYILNSSVREIAANADRTYNTKSTLTYNVSRVNHGIGLYCNASNDENYLVSSKTVRLNVRYLPDTLLYINGHQSYGTFYMIRNSATKQYLQCSVHGGNPLANLSWSCFDGTQTDMNTQSSAISKVSWFAGEWNDSTCTCLASHVLGWSQSQAVSVHVLIQPTLIICKVGNGTLFSGILNVTLLSNVTLTCESLGNPKPNNFTWIWPTHYTSAGQILSFINIQRWIQGNYTLLVENIMNPSIGPTVKGYAKETFNMHVQYHPDTPYFKIETNNMSITTSSISVIMNEKISIACIADGNPPPSYTWSTGQTGKILTATFDSDTFISCEVSNTLYPTGVKSNQARVESSIKINVLYPPDTPVLWINSSCIKNSTLEQNVLRVLEFDHVSVECIAAGTPEPSCQWTNYSQSCTLDITNASKKDTGAYVCLAFNTMNTSYGSSAVGQNLLSFYLDILYPPKITNLNAYVKVLEGVHFSFTCEAEPGNSKETSYFWTSQQLPGIETFGQYLIIQNISRADEGIYTCFARNVMQPSGCTEINGSDVKNITIDVQYKASIITFTAMNTTTTTTTVQHGDEVRFACDVDSDPPADIRILSTNGSILNSINDNYLLTYTKKSSCLEDIGQFTCISANKHNRGQPDKRNVSIDVKCSPLYRPNYFPYTIFKTRPGTKIVLHFSVFSNPPPTQFTWTNISNSMRLPIDTTSDRVIINNTDDMSSSFILTSVEHWDFGNYSVRVENEIGSMIETFHIIVDNDLKPDGETSTSPTSDNGTGSVVGGTVGAVSIVVAIAILIAIFFYKKRQSHHDGDRRRDGSALKDDNRYEDLTISYTRTPTDYSDLDFRCRSEISRMQTKPKESDVYENLKLTPVKSSALT